MCLLMHDTGADESEILEVTPARLDIDARTVTVRTLKKRGGGYLSHHSRSPINDGNPQPRFCH